MNVRGRMLDDCFLHDSERLRHDDCLAIIGRLTAVAAAESLPLARARGRYLAESPTAPRDVPLHTNAAVDGFAFSSAFRPPDGFAVAGRAAAGDDESPPLPEGSAMRIFTGAILPEGADAVAMQEDCELVNSGRRVQIPPGLKPGANIRRAGEDFSAGDVVLERGTILRPQDLAALASIGRSEVRVFGPVRIGLISSGDELVEPGAPIRHGGVFDSNRVMLEALAASLPARFIDYGVLPDRRDTVRQTLERAAAENDIVLTTGGASRGEEDHIVATIGELGVRHLWQLAVKPGRPMTMGQIGQTVIMGLPGNPVAAFVCFILYCRPAITLLGGGTWREPPRFAVPAGFSVARKKAGRREFWRGWLDRDGGRQVARKFARDGSGLVSGLCQASGLIEIGEEVTAVAEGQPVAFIPFESFGILS